MTKPHFPRTSTQFLQCCLSPEEIKTLSEVQEKLTTDYDCCCEAIASFRAFLRTQDKELLRKNEMREFIDKYYPNYKDFLDSNYLTHVLKGGNLTSRYWELLFIKRIKENHPELKITAFKGKKNEGSSDFVVMLEGKKIFIECVCLENATIIKERVPHIFSSAFKCICNESLLVPKNAQPEVSRSNKKIQLRISSAIKEKKDQYERWKSKGLVNEKDGLIIAIGFYGLPWEAVWWFEDCLRFPRGSSSQIPVLGPFFPLGDLAAKITYPTLTDLKPKLLGAPYTQQKDTHQKSNGADVKKHLFFNKDHSFLSAALFSFGLHEENDFGIIHNPYANHVIPAQVFHAPYGDFSFDIETGEINAMFF